MKRLIYCAVFTLAINSASAWAQVKGDPNKTFKGYALDELSAPGLLYNQKAKATYYKALGPLSKEEWLAKLDGPSPQNRRIKVAGADYFLLAACKNRDCENNSTVLLVLTGAGCRLRHGPSARQIVIDRRAAAGRRNRARTAMEERMAIPAEVASSGLVAAP